MQISSICTPTNLSTSKGFEMLLGRSVLNALFWMGAECDQNIGDTFSLSWVVKDQSVLII